MNLRGLAISWENVPGYFDFADLYSEAVSRAPAEGAAFVEVGVMFGKSTLYMAEAIQASGKKIAFDAFDVFGWDASGLLRTYDEIMALPVPGAVDVPAGLRASILAGRPHDNLVRDLVFHAGLEKYVQLVSAKGQERAATYADASLDFVFIDAQHGYQDTVELLRAFLPKLKPTGVIAGHDFTTSFPGVLQAVQDALGSTAQRRGSSFWCSDPHRARVFGPFA
jgi:predicted O-methyltransferase YrrM